MPCNMTCTSHLLLQLLQVLLHCCHLLLAGIDLLLQLLLTRQRKHTSLHLLLLLRHSSS